jgi:glycosyltransferase involved in cell wall biosynthesis
VKLSIIIPAYNESVHIEETIRSVQHSIENTQLQPFEIIVSDDDSTDDTGQLAKDCGAIVIKSGKRNIGATRNVGASIAKGEYVVFLDADTTVSPPLFQELETAIQKNKVIGGGTPVQWNPPTKSFLGYIILKIWNNVSRLFKIPAGSFFFVKKEVFQHVKGFDEEFYATEELHLALKLKKHGQLTILKTPVYTSPRKLYQFTMIEYAAFFMRSAIRPFSTLKNRKHLKIWYERRR